MTNNNPVELSSYDWSAELRDLSHAYGSPQISGHLKVVPQDFIVTELMDVIPSGEGEHTWFDITKTRCNTDAVAKALARFAGVAYRDVAYSGMKDFHAVTRQWFSVWRPKGEPLEWSEFALDGVDVHQIVPHARKIKRGTHRANEFCIRASSLKLVDDDLLQSVEEILVQRLTEIKSSGVPNYFGEQRFGRNVNNMRQAVGALVHDKRIKDRNLRGLLLSSARSWLFNRCVSARVLDGSWLTLFSNEPANLNGTNSVFQAENTPQECTRLEQLDIHPTAPLWGDNVDKNMQNCVALAAYEASVLAPLQPLLEGLEKARLEYQRRPIRSAVNNLSWEFERGEDEKVHGVVLRFELQSGQFATSFIREVLTERVA